MDSGDAIQVHNGITSKTVTVVSVTRGRAVVRWPDVGEYDVDLASGELFKPPGFAHGVFSIDCMTGRVVGTRASVTFEEMPRLDSITVGDTLRLDNGVAAEVVDVLQSEGTIKVFVSASANKSGVWRMASLRTRFRVSPGVLGQLRERAGVATAMAG